MTMTPDLARAAVGRHDKAALLARLKAKKRVAAFVDIVDNDDVVTELQAAKEERDMARLFAGDEAEDPRLVAATAAYDDALAAWTASVTRMHFRALPRAEFEQMILDHPPEQADIDQAKADGDEPPTYNLETFMPALIAASSWLPPSDEEVEAAKAAGQPEPDGTQPLFDAAEVVDLIAEWNQGEVDRVWQCALFVNTAVRSAAIPKG